MIVAFHIAQLRGGDVAQLVEYRTGTPPTQVRFPGAARDFSPRVNFQCRLSDGVPTPPRAIACIYICAHVKDPVVHVRVRWTMETLKAPSMHSRLGNTTPSQLAFPGEGNPNFQWERSPWANTNTVVKKRRRKKKKKRWVNRVGVTSGLFTLHNYTLYLVYSCCVIVCNQLYAWDNIIVKSIVNIFF